MWAGVFVLLAAWVMAAGAHAEPDALPDEVRLLLPEVIHAVPGIEANVYFDNVVLVLDPTDYAFDVTCAKGIQQTERWTYTPSPEDVGAYAFVLDVRNQANQVIAHAESRIEVVDPATGKDQTVSLLLVGDSLTHASVYSQHLLDLCAEANAPTLRLVGSHVPNEAAPANRHEGYGGWTAARFATHYTGIAREGNYKERGSPFLYLDDTGTPALDFNRYCQDVNAGAAPDFVTIFLGCNDTFSATDADIEGRIDAMFTHLDQLIDMIRQASPATHIGLMPPVPPAASQDAFGANYQCGQTRWQYKRNQHRVVERMMEAYANREGISLTPAFVNLDCRHNYPQRASTWNAHNDAACERQCNGVHPSEEGYRQIGDALFCWLKARLAEAR